MARVNGDKSRIGIGALVKWYREEQRVTQRELAAAAGMSVGTLRDLEQGRTRSPRWGTLEELAVALGLGLAQRAELTHAWRTRDRVPVSRQPRSAGPPAGVGIGVLGPLAAWRDGVQLALGSARQRAVLGLLALHAGVGVHRDAIIDMLWDGRPPASAVAVIQGHVSQLRRMLGDGPAHAGNARLIITAVGCSYRLNPDSGHLDLALFGQLIREAREAATRLDPARACDRYERALGLWRGDILVDVGLLEGHPVAVEVTRRRAEAVLGYAEAGAHARALPQLRELCAREPLNEQAHAWLMTVLASTGQQAAALEVFARLRRRLDAELGIAPSPVLAQAHAQVLRQQIGMPAPPSPTFRP